MAGCANYETFSHSKTLFKRDDLSRIVFYMRPCEERQKLRPVIEHGGGRITAKCVQGCIKLAEKGVVITADDYLAAKYVEDCVQQNKLLDTKPYILKKGRYPSSSEKTKSGLVEDGMEPADVIQPALCRNTRNARSTDYKETELRSKYTIEDDMAMLNYIVSEVRYNDVGGYSVFRDMQKEEIYNGDQKCTKFKVNNDTHEMCPTYTKYSSTFFCSIAQCGQRVMVHNVKEKFKGQRESVEVQITKHSFMSMQTRFRKKILPDIDKYDIPNRWKFLLTGDSKYNDKSHQTGVDALFKSKEKPQNQTGSSKKKDLFTHSKLPLQLTDQSENQFPQKGSNAPQKRSSSPQKIVKLDNKQTSTDESNPTTSPAKRSKFIKDNSEETKSVTGMENLKENKSSKQNANNSVSSSDTPKKSRKRMLFDAIELVPSPNQTKSAEDRSDSASKPGQITMTPRKEDSIKIHIGTKVANQKYKKAEEEQNLNHGEADLAQKHARSPVRQQNKANSVGDSVKHIKSPVKQQNETGSEKFSQSKIQKKGSSDIKVKENATQNSNDSQMNSVAASDGGFEELIQIEEDETTLQTRRARYEPLTFKNRVKQGNKKARQKETQTEDEPENDTSQTSPPRTRLQNRQLGNNTDKEEDKNLIVCKEKSPTKSVPSSIKGMPMHTKYMKNDEKHKNKSENYVDAWDNENKVESDSDSFATPNDTEMNVNDSEDDTFVSCEDEFDRYLLEKLETSNNKSGTSSDVKTNNTLLKDFRRRSASNSNLKSNEQNGNDSNSNKSTILKPKGKSPIKRKSDSVEQRDSSDEESQKINKWRKFAPSKQKKTHAHTFSDTDSSELSEGETADDHNSKDAKSSNISSRKSQWGKSGGGQNRFMDYSSVESEEVEDSEEEEKEVAQEVTGKSMGLNKADLQYILQSCEQVGSCDVDSASESGRGKKRAPYLDQIMDTDVESQAAATDLHPTTLCNILCGVGPMIHCADDLTQFPAADGTAEIYNFQDDDQDAEQVKDVYRFVQRTAVRFSLTKSEVFEILLSCNGDTRRAVNWIRFGNDSIDLVPWNPRDDKKLVEGEDIVRLEHVYGAEEVKERALFLEILEGH